MDECDHYQRQGFSAAVDVVFDDDPYAELRMPGRHENEQNRNDRITRRPIPARRRGQLSPQHEQRRPDEGEENPEREHHRRRDLVERSRQRDNRGPDRLLFPVAQGPRADPGGAHDAVSTVEQLFEVLDDQDVNAAIKRIAGRAHFDLVTIEYYGPPEDAPDATEIDDGRPREAGRCIERRPQKRIGDKTRK